MIHHHTDWEGKKQPTMFATVNELARLAGYNDLELNVMTVQLSCDGAEHARCYPATTTHNPLFFPIAVTE